MTQAPQSAHTGLKTENSCNGNKNGSGCSIDRLPYAGIRRNRATVKRRTARNTRRKAIAR